MVSILTVSGRYLEPGLLDYRGFGLGERPLHRLVLQFDPRHPRIDWTVMERDARRALAASSRRIEREYARRPAWSARAESTRE